MIKPRYLVVDGFGAEISFLDSWSGADVIDRRPFCQEWPSGLTSNDVLTEVRRRDVSGVVVTLRRGWPNIRELQIIISLFFIRKQQWIYWANEGVAEKTTAGVIVNFILLYGFITCYRWFHGGDIVGRSSCVTNSQQDVPFFAEMASNLAQKIRCSTPVPFDGARWKKQGGQISGAGVYLRLDYWNALDSGGSYGHTCYVAAQLAQRCDTFISFMANRFQLLEELKVRQIELDRPDFSSSEVGLLRGSEYYRVRLRPVMEVIRPAFIYERLIPGNTAGADLSRDLKIPYIVEFNGSEVSMMRSASSSWVREDVLLAAERAAFSQASLISVVSEPIRRYLLTQGVPDSRILVNPNGVDLDHYYPAEPEEKAEIRANLGIGADEVVVGFIGSFGFWHGIEILAAALHPIISQVPNARFLIIGNGNLHHLITEVVSRDGLSDKVLLPGRVPQRLAARMMRACDIMLSPHDRHMVDGEFFGSPTKLFEYMALGAAIVATDLSQQGQVMTPSLTPEELDAGEAITDQRGVLCRPGDVSHLVRGVVGLCRRPEVRRCLGDNARKAVIEFYSWDAHVSRLFDAVANAPKDLPPVEWRESSVLESTPCPRLTRDLSRFSGQAVLVLDDWGGAMAVMFAQAGCKVTALCFDGESAKGLRTVGVDAVITSSESLPFADGWFDAVIIGDAINRASDPAMLAKEAMRVLRFGGFLRCAALARFSSLVWFDALLNWGVRRGYLLTRSSEAIVTTVLSHGLAPLSPIIRLFTGSGLRRLFPGLSIAGIYRVEGPLAKARGAARRWDLIKDTLVLEGIKRLSDGHPESSSQPKTEGFGIGAGNGHR